MDWVQYAVSEKIATVTMNNPEKRNALSPEMIAMLKEKIQQAADDPEVKVVVLRGNGEAFCAGADLAYLQKMQHFSPEENLADSNQLKGLFWQLYTLPKVVIAQVQGHALAGGCGLVTVCDFCFAEDGARFGYTEVKIGFIPAMVMVFLCNKVGEAKARQWLLTGTLIPAREAYSAGLISCVSEKQKLESDVRNFARQLMKATSAQAVGMTKQLLARLPSLPMEQALEEAAALNARARNTEDCRRGIAAFLDKQKINWY